jgi:hypothetical protein
MNDLIDRYVWAVAKDLPGGLRDDVARELRATIADMVDAREPQGDDSVREVLLELGDPAELALSYAGGRRYLIGPGFYPMYSRLLRLLLLIVVPIVLVVSLVAELWSGADGYASGVGQSLNAAFQTGVMIAFWVTLVFFIIERAGARPADLPGRGAWDPDALPAVAEKRQITLADAIASLVILALLIAWIPWQQSHSVFYASGEPLPFLAQDLWSFWIPAFIAIVAVSMGVEVWKYVAGRWTLPLVVVNIAVNALFVGLVVVVLATQEVVDPAWLAAFQERSGSEFPADVVGAVVLLAVLLISLWDAIDCVRKHLALRRAASAGVEPPARA